MKENASAIPEMNSDGAHHKREPNDRTGRATSAAHTSVSGRDGISWLGLD